MGCYARVKGWGGGGGRARTVDGMARSSWGEVGCAAMRAWVRGRGGGADGGSGMVGRGTRERVGKNKVGKNGCASVDRIRE